MSVNDRCSVSVVIAWVNPLELLTPGLDALQNQRGRRPDEIIVATRHDEVEQQRLRELHAGITILSAPSDAPITTLRSMAIRHARGDIVAVTEDHCVPCPDWIETIVRAMERRQCEVVGGPVENAATSRLRDWAAFLTEYSGAVAPAVGESSNDSLPGNNVAYRRRLIDGLCAVLDAGLWEAFYHRQVAANGVRMHWERDMVVFHNRSFDFRYFLEQRYHFCRSFAGMRCSSLDKLGRIKYGFGSAALPPLLLFRGLTTVVRKRRLVARYLTCLPLITIYIGVGAFGEMAGYFFGPRQSLARVE